MPNLVIPTVVRSLHNIFTSIWVGGMLVTALSILPALRKEISDKKLQNAVIRRFLARQSVWVYLGIAVLAVTGALMARLSGKSAGLFSFADRYSAILSVKHMLFLAVTIVALLRSAMLRKPPAGKDEKRMKMSAALLMLNALLGLAILVLSSLAVVIP